MNIILKRSLRALRTSIRIKQGNVILTVASKGSVSKAYEFLNSHLNFIRSKLESFKPTSFKDGAFIKIMGEEYKIIYSSKPELKNIALEAGQLLVSATVKDHNNAIIKFLSLYLKKEITEMASSICAGLGVKYSKISIKNMCSKWGSCSSSGNLSFSLKLLYFDYEIIKYVVVHEVCHLIEMNHSKKFWTLVESIYPNWRLARAHLKQEGAKIL
jgi:predicted metal-dependent hydrolase